MARGHPGIPRPESTVFRKSDLLSTLSSVDADADATRRVLAMELMFRERVSYHVRSLPPQDARFQKFNTSPFVLLMHAMQRGYTQVSQIERDILPAKQFSSMETSAGRMVEDVSLPVYGWTNVASEMHTSDSVLDGRKLEGDILKLATLKSGPRCLNDEMSENFADAIIGHSQAWASEAGLNQIDFTYAVFYGTKKQSNKKDWHILRNIDEKLPASAMQVRPARRWHCSFNRNDVNVEVTVRIGKDWWDYLGGTTCFVELCAAMIRACVQPGECDPEGYAHMISDLGEIISMRGVSRGYNVSILQRSQLQWFFFVARHFCDEIVD